MKRLIPKRSIFNFLKAKPLETKAVESNAIQQPLTGQVQINKEETKLLWDLYEPKEEEGLHQFESALTNQIQELDSLTKSEELTQLTTLIDKTNRALQMKFKREHTYELKQYEERLYKEVIYDTRKANTPTEEEEFKFMNPLKRANKGGTRIRNINQLAQQAQEIAVAPSYQRRPTLVGQVGKSSSEKIYDPFDYFRTGPFSAEDEAGFTNQEQTFLQLMLMRNDYLTKIIWREQEYYQKVPRALPLLIDSYLYFRRIDNPADSLTLYRIQAEGRDLGESPSIDTKGVETVFSLKDLIGFYEKYAMYDERIKVFCEKVTERVKLGEHQDLLYSFQIQNLDTEFGKAKIAVLMIDTEQNGTSYDIIVKDLDQQLLTPVLILNSDGQVAFDSLAGFYYTQVDDQGRGVRVFRHQVGTTQEQDILIYNESENANFSVSVENTLSKELIQLKITSTFKPVCNEIWLRNASEVQSKFQLVQAMQPQVRYHIKHQGDWLYKISNEVDKFNFRVTKFRLSDELKSGRQNFVKIGVEPETSKDVTIESSQPLTRLGGKFELMPASKYLEQRTNQLVPLENDSATGLATQETVYSPDNNEIVHGVEVFKNYMAILVEKNQTRQLKCLSLRSNKLTTHYFDSSFEVNPQTKQLSDFFDVNLEDNYSFDNHQVRYKLTTPIAAAKTLTFNMATKQTSFVSQEHVTNMHSNLTCEKIEVTSRDGTLIPVVMLYDQRFYSEKSPWVMLSNGVSSQKEDLGFRPELLSLTDRGIVLSFPMVRGTRYFDDNWFFSGTGDRKRVHVEDIVDTAIFIKDQNLTDKIALIGNGASGSHAALTSVLWEPYLFHGATFYNPICDLPNYLNFDIINRTSTSKQKLVDLQHSARLEFGTQNEDFLLSPYHLPMENRPITDLLFCTNQDDQFKYHSRKMVAKIRDIFSQDPLYAFYREFSPQMYTEEQKRAEMYSFVVQSLLFNN